MKQNDTKIIADVWSDRSSYDSCFAGVDTLYRLILQDTHVTLITTAILLTDLLIFDEYSKLVYGRYSKHRHCSIYFM